MKVLGYEGDCPVVACKAIWILRYWSITFNCPWCGREHRHGGGNGKVPSAGYRATHCSNDGKLSDHDYILKVVETVGEWTPLSKTVTKY